MREVPEKVPPQSGSSIGCLFRVIWIVGILPLGILAANMGIERRTSLSIVDLVFWCLVAALIGARFADVKWFKGTTAKGEPATMATWLRFSMVLAAISLLIWLAAHGAAFVLPG